MNQAQKGLQISRIMAVLRDRAIKKNKELAAQNREQAPFDAGKLFFDLAFMDDKEFNKISKIVLG